MNPPEGRRTAPVSAALAVRCTRSYLRRTLRYAVRSPQGQKDNSYLNSALPGSAPAHTTGEPSVSPSAGPKGRKQAAKISIPCRAAHLLTPPENLALRRPQDERRRRRAAPPAGRRSYSHHRRTLRIAVRRTLRDENLQISVVLGTEIQYNRRRFPEDAVLQRRNGVIETLRRKRRTAVYAILLIERKSETL